MERGEFISYVEREQAHLRRFLLALCCGNADEADDIAQDALVKAYLSSSSYNDEGKFGVWICKIAYNTFLDRKRASKQSDTLDEATLVQDDTFAADRTYEYQDLYKAIAALPVKERTAILLYYLLHQRLFDKRDSLHYRRQRRRGEETAVARKNATEIQTRRLWKGMTN